MFKLCNVFEIVHANVQQADGGFSEYLYPPPLLLSSEDAE